MSLQPHLQRGLGQDEYASDDEKAERGAQHIIGLRKTTRRQERRPMARRHERIPLIKPNPAADV